LAQHLSQASAKLNLLVGDTSAQATFKSWADGIGVSGDAALQLRDALADVKDRGLRPTDEMLKQVRANVTAMGGDADAAMVEFVTAFAKGGDELDKVQRKVGQVVSDVRTLGEYGRAIGADTIGQGIEKSLTDAEAYAASLRRLQVQEQVLTAANQARNEAGAAYSAALLTGNGQQIQATSDRVRATNQELERTQALYNAHAASFDSWTKATLGIRTAKDAITDAEQAALGITDKTAASQEKIRINAIKVNQLSGEKAILEGLAATGLIDQYEALQKIRGEITATLTETKGLQDQIEADRKSKADKATADAKSAADKAKQAAEQHRAALDIAAQAQVRLTKAEIAGASEFEDLTGLKLKLIAQEEQAAVLAAQHLKTSTKGRLDAETAAHKEAAQKRQQLAIDAGAEEKRLADENLTILEGQAKQSVQFAKDAADARQATDQQSSTLMIARLRERGREQDALSAERLQAEADYGAELIRIDAETQQKIAETKAVGADAQAIEEAGDDRAAQASLKLFELKRGIAEKEKALARDKLAGALDPLAGVAASIQALSQIGDGSPRLEAVGKSLGIASKGAQDVIKNLGDTPKAVHAAGQAAEGIADSIIDGETKRTVGQLDQEEKRQLSTAKTEEEKAKITQKFEQKKADALASAERQKAGIRTVVEAAEAIASFAAYDYVGGAGHAAAAVAFGAIAGGAGGSPTVGAAGGPSGAGGGFNQSQQGSGGSGGGSKGGNTTVINFNQPLATKQEIGRVIQSATRSIDPTGFAKAKGV
jgi:hypothetical protein